VKLHWTALVVHGFDSAVSNQNVSISLGGNTGYAV